MNRLLDDIVHKELSLMRKENLFLQHDLMGYAIFCFWYGRMSQDDKYTKIAERCLMHVCKSVNNKCSLGISDGLSGIGIGICYLTVAKTIWKEIPIDYFKVLTIICLSNRKRIATRTN